MVSAIRHDSEFKLPGIGEQFLHPANRHFVRFRHDDLNLRFPKCSDDQVTCARWIEPAVQRRGKRGGINFLAVVIRADVVDQIGPTFDVNALL